MKNWDRITIETSDDGGKITSAALFCITLLSPVNLQKTPAKSEQVFVGVPTRIVSVNSP